MLNQLITRGDLIRYAVDELIEEAYFDELGTSLDDDYLVLVKQMVDRVNNLLDSATGELIRLGWIAAEDLFGFEEPENFSDIIEQRLITGCSKQIDLLNNYYECEILEIVVLNPHFDILIEFRS